MEDNKFKDFWAKAHMGAIVHDPTRSLANIKPLESYRNNFTEAHVKVYCKEPSYKSFNTRGVFGNGAVFDAVMFSTMF